MILYETITKHQESARKYSANKLFWRLKKSDFLRYSKEYYSYSYEERSGNKDSGSFRKKQEQVQRKQLYHFIELAVQKQDDQHEHIFSNYVRIQDVVLKTCLRRWTIGKSGEGGSGISVLPARHDDDDDDRASSSSPIIFPQSHNQWLFIFTRNEDKSEYKAPKK